MWFALRTWWCLRRRIVPSRSQRIREISGDPSFMLHAPSVSPKTGCSFSLSCCLLFAVSVIFIFLLSPFVRSLSLYLLLSLPLCCLLFLHSSWCMHDYVYDRLCLRPLVPIILYLRRYEHIWISSLSRRPIFIKSVYAFLPPSVFAVSWSWMSRVSLNLSVDISILHRGA